MPIENRDINISITSFEKSEIVILKTNTPNEEFSELFENKNIAIKDRTNLRLGYLTYTTIFAVGSLGGGVGMIVTALDNLNSLYYRHAVDPSNLAIMLIFAVFADASRRAGEISLDKLKILDEQIKTLESLG